MALQCLNNWLRTIKNNTSKEFYACTLRWLKEKEYFFNIKHNDDFEYTKVENIFACAYPIPFMLIFLCDAYNDGEVTPWSHFFVNYLTVDDFKKYFSSLKFGELRAFASQYVEKYNIHMKHQISIKDLMFT